MRKLVVLVASGFVAQSVVAQNTADALDNALAACRAISESGKGVTCSLSQREAGLFDLILVARSHESLGSFVVTGADIAKTVCLKNPVLYTNSVMDEKGYVRSMMFKCDPLDHKLTKYKGWHVNGVPTAETQPSGQ